MNDRFLNLAKINKDVRDQLDLWRASEEYRIPYPKLEFYIKYMVIMNLRSGLRRAGVLQEQPGRAGADPGGGDAPADPPAHHRPVRTQQGRNQEVLRGAAGGAVQRGAGGPAEHRVVPQPGADDAAAGRPATLPELPRGGRPLRGAEWANQSGGRRCWRRRPTRSTSGTSSSTTRGRWTPPRPSS